MSVNFIPPPLVGAALQSPLAQKQQAQARDAEANQAAVASRELANLDQHLDTEVETAEAESRVHTDSGGQGSRGRSFSDEDTAPDQDDVASVRDEPPPPRAGGSLDVTV